MHKPIIIAACSLFAIAYIGDVLLWQPYSTAGYFLSPPLLVIGIILWLRFYRSSRGHYPRLKSIRNEAVFNGRVLTLRQGYLWRHKYELWACCFAVLMGIIPLIGISFSRSGAFSAITTYCNSTDRVKSKR